jgi:16S rRNA (guanine1207-N2)-methyltransferase
MTRDAVKTLFHPFATLELTPPPKGERVLFLGAEAGYDHPEGFEGDVTYVQAFRPLYNGLTRRGIEAQPFAEGEDYDMVLILLTRHRGQNENFIVDALKRTKAGARIVLAGSKEDGIQSLRKRVGALGLDTEHLAKHHAQAFWFTRPADVEPYIKSLSNPAASVAGKFLTNPGMFSHGEADPGSVFLARYLPKGFKKLAADFGAGWGFLAAELYAASPEIEGIDLYEADHASMEAARANINRLAPKLSARYFWHDLAREEVKNRYDLIIMNPPFHESAATEPALGQALIKAASIALRAGGELLLVANRGLPYEPFMKEQFKSSSEIARNARYKVLSGKK